MADRRPTKPFSALLTDYPDSRIDLANFTKPFHVPANITTYGLFINGINYVADCQTRYGLYAFCDNMRVPSYSLAKSSLAGAAMMWLGQQYGSQVYQQLIRNYVPEHVLGGDWKSVTFANASDMATGNYTARSREIRAARRNWLFSRRKIQREITNAVRAFPHKAAPGTTLFTSPRRVPFDAGHECLLAAAAGKRRRYIFNAIRDERGTSRSTSVGEPTTLRTDNSPSGKPFGGYGLFLIPDQIAKLGRLLNYGHGSIAGKQVLMRATDRIVIPHSRSVCHRRTCARCGKAHGAHTFRYHNFFWGKP